MKVRIIIALLIPLFLGACSSDRLGGAYKEVKATEGFAVELPAQLERTHELHDFAGLQFANEKEGVYLIGIVEPKKALRNLHLYYNLEDYAHTLNHRVGMGMDTFTVSLQHKMQVDSLPCITSDIFGTIYGGPEPLEVYYNVSVFETPDHFFQLVSWTDRDYLPDFKPTLEQIVCSVQNLPENTEGLDEAEKGIGGEGLGQ